MVCGEEGRQKSADLMFKYITDTAPIVTVCFEKQQVITHRGVISGMTILLTVSVGLAIMLAIGFFRVYYNIPLYLILLGLYSIIFIMSFFTSGEFLAISFDASGSTTGILAVPFILALSLGISTLKKDSKASEKDSKKPIRLQRFSGPN